ncbi:WXG100 family type VII secretion target [Tomitella gaofuii]|uniref:WXG100 family type VII secretion target n=1 Tax=Tomitella gaofuii TaxID=2760083 RepID=UPI0015FAD68E|nr:WXG100 family type VII secretion target [Tomitella gaofuii]
MALTTDTEVMRASAQGAMDASEQMKATLGRLNATVEGVAASWQGDAHTAFAGVMQRYHASMNKMQLSLVEISENIKGNSVGYEGASQDSAQSLSQVGGALDL